MCAAVCEHVGFHRERVFWIIIKTLEYFQSYVGVRIVRQMCSPYNYMLAVSVTTRKSAVGQEDDTERAAMHTCEKFMTALKRSSWVPPRMRCRSIRGQVKVMARVWHDGMTSLLCVDKGCLSVVGGAELDETMLCIPLQYVRVNLVPEFNNMFQISVLSQVADGNGSGIFVAVKDGWMRDRWLASLTVITKTKIDGWMPRADMTWEVEQRLCMNGMVPLVKWMW